MIKYNNLQRVTSSIFPNCACCFYFATIYLFLLCNKCFQDGKCCIYNLVGYIIRKCDIMLLLFSLLIILFHFHFAVEEMCLIALAMLFPTTTLIFYSVTHVPQSWFNLIKSFPFAYS